MSRHVPDKWVVVYHPEHDVHTILAGWGGGYLHGDSWRRSTPLQYVVEHDEYYEVHNESGSVYECNKRAYGTTGLTAQVIGAAKGGLQALDREAAVQLVESLQNKGDSIGSRGTSAS